MNKRTVLLAGNTPAIVFAGQLLQKAGVIVQDQANLNTQYVLFDVPSFLADGNLRNGRSIDTLLAALPKEVILCGGHMHHQKIDAYARIDLLQDEMYLAANAAITAECAVRIAMQHLTSTITDSPCLIIGWGRIGKCLAQLLSRAGCHVTVAARGEKDRAILCALGYDTIDIPDIDADHYRLIFNTVPTPVLDVHSHRNCIKIDLASAKGLTGDDVIWARGLPGMYAPETSGKLIAETFLHLTSEVKT